ncbi:MAG TPA: DUF5916 domain-containing protein [Gemmatimonadaceae bacterium]|nr:DUF5916 domain-containing protein [Gemmatimonadaceae bacterium]
MRHTNFASLASIASRGLRSIGAPIASLSLAVASQVAGAQSSGQSTENRDRPAVMASRIDVAPVIDGRTDDVAWATGPTSTDFRVFAPREGADPTVRTEARVRYDDRALYFLVRAFDPHPDSIVRRLARRDTPDGTADQVLLFLDPFHDGRTGYEFVVTAGGVKVDAALSDDIVEDYSWDGVWDVATRIDSLGWVAEFAIPFRQLRFAEHRAPVFGIFIGRWVGRSGERMCVPQYSRARAGLVSQMGTLGGLRDLATSGALEATPYTRARSRNVATAVSQGTPTLETEAAVGGDIKWLPRPNVSIDATFNPDFGQIDADPAVLNLTGVEIFQAERRPFFLEGAGLLALPLSADGSGQLFYSRRIGRRPTLADAFGAPDSPTETTILGAAKVTARITPTTSIAALAAATGRADGRERPDGRGRYVLEPRAANLVARVQQDFRGGRSGVGVLLTRVARDDGDSTSAALLPSEAQTVALTTQHQTGSGAYQASGWLALSDVRGRPDAIAQLQLSSVHAYQRPDDGVAFDPTRDALRGSAAFLSLGKVGGGITRFAASYRRIEPGFDVNDLGILTKSGVQNASANVGLTQNRPGSIALVPYRRATLTLGYSGEWSTNGMSYGRAVDIGGSLQLANLAQLQATVIQQLPGALCTVSCTRGGPAMIDPPRTTLSVDYTGDPRQAFVPHVLSEYDRDDHWRSHGYGAQIDGTWRARSNVEIWLAAYAFNTHYAWFYYDTFGDVLSDTAHYTVAALDLPTRSLTSRINYTLTPTMTLQWYGQAYISRGAYDDVREVASPRSPDWNERFRPYGDAAVRASPGGIDFKQLRSNAVLRWEYRPGSTLFVVWSHGRDLTGAEPARLGLWPARDFGDLFALHPQNTVAVKLSYWMSR